MFRQGKSFQTVQPPFLLSKAYIFKAPGKPAPRSIPAGGPCCPRFPPHPHLLSASHLHLLTAHCAHSGQLTLGALCLLTRPDAALGTDHILSLFCVSQPPPPTELCKQEGSTQTSDVTEKNNTHFHTSSAPRHSTKGEQDQAGVLRLTSNKDSFTSTYY